MHLAAPTALYLPGSHEKHSSSFVTLPNRPAAQGMHAPCAGGAYFPRGHPVHFSLFFTAKVPPGQVPQPLAPEPLYFPAGQ